MMAQDFVTVVEVDGDCAEEYVTVLNVGGGDDSEDVLVYRLPGERLGFGLKFEGGTSTSERVRRLFIQSTAPDSPASRARCSWGGLQEGDEVLQIDAAPVTSMTRLDCVRCLKESSVVIKLQVRHAAPPPPPPPIPPRRKQQAAVLGPPTAFADEPPEAEVYLDLFAQEDLSCLTGTESESDDTGSSISTVVANHIDLARVLGPFEQLERELDDTNTLQPPLNFQDAPLSYGDEKVLPPKPAARFRSGKKRPPPPPPPRTDRPPCPVTIAVEETDRGGDLPRLVDVVPKNGTSVVIGNGLVENGTSVVIGNGPVVIANNPIRTDSGHLISIITETREEVEGKEQDAFRYEESVLHRPAGIRENGTGNSSPVDSLEYRPVLIEDQNGNISSDEDRVNEDDIAKVVQNRPVPHNRTIIDHSAKVKHRPEEEPTYRPVPHNRTLVEVENRHANKNRPLQEDNRTQSAGDLVHSMQDVAVENSPVITEETPADSNVQTTPVETESSHDITDCSPVSHDEQEADNSSVELETIPVSYSVQESCSEAQDGEECRPVAQDKQESSVEADCRPLEHNSPVEATESPFPQEVQESSPVDAENSPVCQNVQEDSSVEGTNSPVAQEVQEESPVEAENSPVEEENSPVEAENSSVGQNVWEGSPVEETYSPVVQEVQENSPVEAENSPVGQNVREGSPVEETYSSVVQEVQENSPVEAENSSVGQNVQEDSPVEGTNSPVVQKVQENSPVEAENSPVGQNVQEGGPVEATNSPAVQEVQENSPVGHSPVEATNVEESSPVTQEVEDADSRPVVAHSRDDAVADAVTVDVPVREAVDTDSDGEDFLLDLPETELLEQGGSVFQPATGALLTASDATFFPFRCWGASGHLATIGEDEEDDASVPGVSVDEEEEEEEDELSPTSRLDNLLHSAEQEPELQPDEPVVTPAPPDGDTAMEEAAQRLPPDGHEFPPNYTEHNPFTVELPPPRKLSPSWRKDEKSECSVRDKIAMFSAASGDVVSPRRRFSSSEDVYLDCRPPVKPPQPTSYFSTLPRKPVSVATPTPTLSRATSFSGGSNLHTRSQSLIDIGRGTVDDMRKASLNALIEQRRRGISKLRGLVIPEKVSEVSAPSHTICDLPEIRSRDSILSASSKPVQRPASRWSVGAPPTTNNIPAPLVMPSPPWKSSSNLPKYSPAFKRKSLTVYGSSPNSAEPPASLESITSPTRSDVSFEYKTSSVNKMSGTPGRRSVEDDSDNDSAVSSSRSSISPPPTPPPPPLLSPLRRTLSSETTASAASSTTSTLTCGSSDSNRRVLKAQSVEAINRKNVLSSARYSSGRDLKVGSPLIQRKFDEDDQVVYLDEVEAPDVEDKPVTEDLPPTKPLPAPRRAPVPVQRRMLETGPDEETDLLSVLTGGKGTSQIRRQRSKESVLGDNRRSVSVHDIRKAFEKAEQALANSGRKVNHARVSSLDSTASEDSFTPQQYGSVGNLHREQFGSVTSIASSTSLISPQELQVLIDEANQQLEDSAGTMVLPVHDVVVVVLHREGTTGSVGITLAGGADYEAKEITVHKVLVGSPADRDGRIQKGDRILSINGRSMKGVTHRESLNILKAPRPEVVLVVSRSRGLQDGNQDDDCPVTIQRPSRPPRIPEQPLETVASPLEGDYRGPPVTVTLTKDGAGLGFSLEGGKDSPLGDKPLTIKKIFTGGSAEKNGELRAGDELLNVNGSDVTVMSRIEAWGLMKRLADGPVALTVRHRLSK